MFDDYNYKHTNTRISVRFVQKRDEPMYPWEIAGFLKTLNTVYYKHELLNSICSAINHGISPSDIFIFNKSLPLYKRYTEMNLLDERQAAKYWYEIGFPYPLVPSVYVYEYNLMYQFFKKVNSFLRSRNVRPLTTESVTAAYDVLRQSGLDAVEKFVIALALERAQKSVDNAKKKKEKKEPISEQEIIATLSKYRVTKNELLDDIKHIQSIESGAYNELVITSGKIPRRRAAVLLAFFRYFDKTSRPLVCVRVDGDKFRVLGRSLVNKKERTGLEVKEVRRYSPLGAIIVGGVAMYQAIQQDRRAEELHALDLKMKSLDIKVAEEELKQAKLQTFSQQLDIADKLDKIATASDIRAVNNMKESFVTERIRRAYSNEGGHATSLLHRQGLVIDPESIHLLDAKIDVKA